MKLRKKVIIIAMALSIAVTPVIPGQYAGVPSVKAEEILQQSKESSQSEKKENEQYQFHYLNESTLQIDTQEEVEKLSDLVMVYEDGFPKVEKVIIGSKVNVQAYWLGMCFPNLKEIQVSKDNPKLMAKGGVLFDKKGETLLAYPEKGKAEYVVPEGTKIIDHSAFSGTAIEKVTIAKSVKKIRPDAFLCSSLKSIKMYDNSVTYIGSGAFSYTNLTSVRLPKGLTRISGGLFEHSSLTSVEIPSSVTTIQSFAFSETKMKTISIPASVNFIDDRTFYKTKIKNMKISSDNGRYTVYKGGVYNKAKTYLFFYLEGNVPAKLEFASTLKSLDVTKLENIKGNELVIPRGLTSISYARRNQFKKVSIASGNKAFVVKGNVLYSRDMKELLLYPVRSSAKHVVLAEGLQTINMNVFGYNDNNIVTLTLPKSLKKIVGSYRYPTIPGCGFHKLTTIKVKSGNRYFTAKDGILYSKDMTKLHWFPINKKIKSYTVPASVVQIRNATLAKQNHLESLTISAKCTSVAQQFLGDCGLEYQFYPGIECPKLKEINFKSTKAGFISKDGLVYSKDYKKLWFYPQNKRDKEYKLHPNCKYIGNAVNNKYIEKLYLPDKLDYRHYDEDLNLKGFTNVKEYVIADSNKSYKTVNGVLYSKGESVKIIAYPMGRRNAELVLPADLDYLYVPYEIREPGYINSVRIEEGCTNFYLKDNCLYDKEGNLEFDFNEIIG